MSGLFLEIVNMSISAGWIVLAVLLLRLLLKKAPKWTRVLLWGIVAVRLICPFTFESVISLMPSAQTITMSPSSPRPHFESGIEIMDNTVNEYLGGHYFEGVTRPEGHFTAVTTILSIVWLVGVVLLLAYAVISYLNVKSRVKTAILLGGTVYQSERAVSPFVLGTIRPKIYLPFSIDPQDIPLVVAHERAHISRGDHIYKPLGFLILALHWFNPLVWLSYVLLCRDIELACDERVIKSLNTEQKADYSQALLTCSVNRRKIIACPLAFGEVSVKDRVKSVLNYKKPAFWVVATSVVAAIAVAVCFLTSPKTSGNVSGQSNASYEYSKDGWVAQKTERTGDGSTIVTKYQRENVKQSIEETKNGNPVKTTYFDIDGKAVTLVSFDGDGNENYTYYYEDGSIAPGRTYSISRYENGTYIYTRLYYHPNGKAAQVNSYNAGGKPYFSYKYNTAGELVEEISYDENGVAAYRLIFSYKHRADGSVSEQKVSDAGAGLLYTRFVDKNGIVTKTVHRDGTVEIPDQSINAGIYFSPVFFNQY